MWDYMTGAIPYDTYTYEQEPDLYDLNDQDPQTGNEERLVANKTAARQEK